MFADDQYQLLDFGDGRRLERFGEVTLDRPCPVAEGVPRHIPSTWPRADARFERTDAEQGQWTCRRPLPERWTIAAGSLRLELKRTVFGHIGVFPEQAENWEWIAREVDRLRQASGEAESEEARRPRVLNLFAYTGGSTLAAAAAGAEVVHVDAARNIVAWARRNAELSGLAHAPIRWIAEDAWKFVKRELRRGNRYDAVILDPPSYGHGPHGEVWRLSSQLASLLERCAELTAGRRRFMLLTCHTPGFTSARLREMACDAIGGAKGVEIEAKPLRLAAAGRELPCGEAVRWREDRES